MFFFITLYVINNIIENRRIFAKRNSSKVFILKIVSERNWIIKTITSPRPDKSCSMPSTGPADTREVRKIVKNVGMLFFMLELVVLGLYNFSVVIFIKNCDLGLVWI